MSILIKGIDMPKDIDELRLIINGMSIAIEPTKAIQIPTPHGRLIDGDELKSIKSIQSADFNSIETIQKWIDNAPTILEAEGEDDLPI